MNNRSEDFGHFLFGEYENINFLFELDAHFNSTNNFTGNSTLVNSFYFYEKEQLTMLWILFASIVLGNSSVLIALLLDKSRTSRFNYFIKHLAIADLSVGFVSVLTDIIWKLTIEWNAGNVACKMIRYSQAVVTYSSTYLLVALTIDRYDAIRHPMNFFKSWKRAKLLVMSAWILSMIFSIPIIVLYEEKTIQGHLQCWIEFIEPWQWQMYMIVISLTVFFIPALIIAGCYTTIIYTIWSHPNTPPNRRLRRREMGSLSEQPTEDFGKIVSSRSLIPKARVKTVKMTLIIVFVFTFCWSPYIVFDLLQVFGYVKRTQTNIAVATFIQSLAPLNSAANPIIYCLFSTYICRHLRIQKYFRSISKCCCCCASRLRKGAKITDKSTSTVLSHATSGRYLNLQHFTRLDRLSSADKKIVRGKVSVHAFHNYFSHLRFGITSEGPPPSFIPISLAQFNCIQCADDPLGVRQKIFRSEMTVSELSEKAKAFSVERLLSGRIDGDVRGKKFAGKAKGDGRVLTRGGITAELWCSELWEKFNRLATEMIVTKAGRRMFPTLKLRLQGLQFTANYILYMDFTLAGDTKYRYNFHRSEWTFAGPSSICDSNSIYVHPNSPALGDVWMSQLISFDKVKLTNHRKPVMLNQVSLHSMHKYQPRIHVLEMSTDCTQNILDYIHAHSERSVMFAFEQTTFITVTAYQNQEITKLKIESNPFAKGFRDSSNAKKEAPTGSSTHGPSSGKISNR